MIVSYSRFLQRYYTYEGFSLLGYNAVQSGGSQLIFRRNIIFSAEE
jgi:hypothetical protein